MKTFLFFLLSILAVQANAQQFFFPKENYKDSAALADNISSLAAKVMTVNAGANNHTDAYYDQMFRYAIVARQYVAAISYLDSLRSDPRFDDSLATKGIGVQYEMYATTKLQQRKSNQSFNELFKKLFREHYRLLSKEAKAIASGYAGVDVKSVKENLDKYIQANEGGDTLSLDNAKALVNAYNSYLVYSHTQELMQLIIIDEDSKAFSVNKVLIKTRSTTFQKLLVNQPAAGKVR